MRHAKQHATIQESSDSFTHKSINTMLLHIVISVQYY